MALIFQIAIGLVLGAILLSVFPILIVSAIKLLGNMLKGIGFALLGLIGILCLYGLFYLVWFYSIEYIPKGILVTLMILSIAALLICFVYAIIMKISIPEYVWVFGAILILLSIMVISLAWKQYQALGSLGNQLNYTAPFYVFLAILAISGIMNHKKKP